MTILITLTFTALLTATLSGILGMGGGMLLLAVMFCFLPHGQAIPLHAAVQLVSNGSRVVVFWGDIEWRTVARFTLGVVPGGVLGAVILSAIGGPGSAEPFLKMVIGVYLLVTVCLPKPEENTHVGTRYDFAFLGVGAGLAALVVGSVGPLIAPLFARRAFVKERLIATKAACQMLTHVLKIPVFWMLGSIDFAEFSTLLLAMSVAAVTGTLLGKRILHRVSPRLFLRYYRVAIVLAAVKIMTVDGVLELIVR